MQYYIKIFNTKTNELVGYYKETGKNCVSKLPNGIKYWDNLEAAENILLEIDDGFLRDKDKHYYSAQAVIYGDHTKNKNLSDKKSNQEIEEELKDALEAFIRQNRGRNVE